MPDILIIGGGLSGCAMAWTLHKQNISFKWLDRYTPTSPSNVAAGIITPIVPKRFALTWQHDRVIPMAHAFYNDVQNITKGAFYKSLNNILIPESVVQMNEWQVKCDNQLIAAYIHKIYRPNSIDGLRTPHGAIEINNAGVIDTPAYIKAIHHYFSAQLSYTERIPINKETIEAIRLKYQAVCTILCTGWYPDNEDVGQLPFKPAKGETLAIAFQNESFQLNNIIQQHIYVAPVSNHNIKIGATYEWNQLDNAVTSAAREHLLNEAANLFDIPFEVISHDAAVRPATLSRRPILGRYPGLVDTYILNGMGTKGLLLAPWTALQLSNYILQNTPLAKEIDVLLQRRK